jgi:DNA-binding PadR family transcriptional regulator
MASSAGKRTRTAYAVLGFLTEGAKSGYEIKQDIEERAGHFWNESFGQIYPILKKLTADGLIEKVDSEQTGKRSRQRYAITESGLEELKEWVEEPVEFEVIRSELMLKIFFGAHVDMDTSLQHLEDYKSHLLRLRKRIEKSKAGLSAQLNADSPEAACKLVTMNWGIDATNTGLKWIQETKEQLVSLSS